MKNALNNQLGMLGDMFLWLVTNLKQGVIYFIKQALPPNISPGSVVLEYLVESKLEKKAQMYTYTYRISPSLPGEQNLPSPLI